MDSRIIGVVSGKGGVGKTTTVINLSAALNQMNRNVLAVDADIKMSGLGLQLGMYYFPITINHALKDLDNIYQSIYIHSSGLRIMPASLHIDNSDISSLAKILQAPALQNNFILIDSPPGLEKNAVSVMKSCEKILIVTEPELPAVSDVMKIIKLSNDLKIQVIGIIVNKYRKGKDQITSKEIESACGVPVLGVVPEDVNVKKSIFKREPVVFLKPYSPASLAYKKIAGRLVGIQYKDSSPIKKLFGRF